ncbi:MAG TPA: 60S ribosomal protein L26 [Candidatus Thalassarchaeaceae archaeon]|nr:60S ribosomal protein L26 [Candidatus Thalassarchaeaceae archaeon]
MASKKAGKQRLASKQAPIHVRRKRMRSRLITNDPQLVHIRSVTVREGDEVEVLRGDFSHPNSRKADSRGKRLGQSRGRSGITAKVASVDTKMGHIFIDGLTHTTADGKEEPLPINPSNVVVTKLYDGDPIRIKSLIDRADGGGVE